MSQALPGPLIQKKNQVNYVTLAPAVVPPLVHQCVRSFVSLSSIIHNIDDLDLNT